jgi:ABC-type sugar transport system substrate-binding protein
MQRRRFVLGLVHTALFSTARIGSAERQPHVVFLNPGEADERGTGPFWRMVTQFMQPAARSLGLHLEVLYAERDHLLMVRQAEDVARRSLAPDYVIIVNEKLAAPQMLKTLARSPAKVFVMHNDLRPEQRREIGNERQQIRNWIGTATTDTARGGYILMEYLCRRLGNQEPRIIGITGDPAIPASMERADGVKRYVAHAGRGRIHQLAFGDWSYADGERKAAVLLARYADTNIIWAANDAMALGVLRAVQAREARVLVGGMAGFPDAITSIAEGGLAATSAGGYLIGAWAVVMLHDYHRGVDFAVHGGLAQKFDQLYVVHRENVSRFSDVALKRSEALDFRVYSKALNPRPGPYDFRLARLVEPGKV